MNLSKFYYLVFISARRIILYLMHSGLSFFPDREVCCLVNGRDNLHVCFIGFPDCRGLLISDKEISAVCFYFMTSLPFFWVKWDLSDCHPLTMTNVSEASEKPNNAGIERSSLHVAPQCAVPVGCSCLLACTVLFSSWLENQTVHCCHVSFL